jgi:hypothetical protein
MSEAGDFTTIERGKGGLRSSEEGVANGVITLNRKEMNLPPSLKNRKEAVAYVASLRKEGGESDFQAISALMLKSGIMGTMFLILSVRTIDVLPWYKVAFSIATLAGGIFFLVLAYRLFGLLQVFDDGRPFHERLEDDFSKDG